VRQIFDKPRRRIGTEKGTLAGLKRQNDPKKSRLNHQAAFLFLRCRVSERYRHNPLNAGAGERSRTLDLLITSELLYQLSYTGKFGTRAPKG
jgi:hypothetical protein